MSAKRTAPADDAAAGTVTAGAVIVLWEPGTGRRWLVTADGGGARKIAGLGIFDPDRIPGRNWGDIVEAAGKRLVAVRPHPEDLHATVRRKAQIIMAKDIARIAFELGIAPGVRVFESGIGSAAATVALAGLVGPAGRVVVQELREDFAKWGADNVAAAGFADRVEIHIGDLTHAVAAGIAGPFDAVLLDQPQADGAIAVLAAAERAAPGAWLAAGGRLAAYCPQVSQMEAVARALAAAGFAGVRALETLERAWETKERGSRPAFDGLMHTAFLVFARWPGQAVR
jgi:tRNA (adenine57-N1/adenine58-N1)-methyltransferase